MENGGTVCSILSQGCPHVDHPRPFVILFVAGLVVKSGFGLMMRNSMQPAAIWMLELKRKATVAFSSCRKFCDIWH